jgi:hypothetical protein
VANDAGTTAGVAHHIVQGHVSQMVLLQVVL